MGGCLLGMPQHECTIGIGWRQGFLTQGLATKMLHATVPLGKTSSLFANYTHFGDQVYHEQQTLAGTAITLTRWLNSGVYAIYSHIGSNDGHYDSEQWLDGGVIIQASVSKTVSTYATAYSRLWDERRKAGGRIGIVYQPTHTLVNVAELSIDERIRLRGGMEYTYGKHIAARAGLATNPLILTFGVGYTSQRYTVDLGTDVHPTLGLSPQISLAVCL